MNARRHVRAVLIKHLQMTLTLQWLAGLAAHIICNFSLYDYSSWLRFCADILYYRDHSIGPLDRPRESVKGKKGHKSKDLMEKEGRM